jgi:hypothetical protein
MEEGGEVPKKLNVFALFAGNLSSGRLNSPHQHGRPAAPKAGLVELSTELRRVFGMGQRIRQACEARA